MIRWNVRTEADPSRHERCARRRPVCPLYSTRVLVGWKEKEPTHLEVPPATAAVLEPFRDVGELLERHLR